jgi:hypothetical protein
MECRAWYERSYLQWETYAANRWSCDAWGCQVHGWHVSVHSALSVTTSLSSFVGGHTAQQEKTLLSPDLGHLV